MNDFHTDNEWQRAKRDAVLRPYYGRAAFEGRFVFLDRGDLAAMLQHRGVDTIVQCGQNRVICIEEKLVRWPGYHYDAFCLETASCTVPGHERHGWMHYGQADYLGYGFEQRCGGLEFYMIRFPELRGWFWPRIEQFQGFQMETRNKTCGKKVPIKDVEAAGLVTMKRFLPLAQGRSGETAAASGSDDRTVGPAHTVEGSPEG